MSLALLVIDMQEALRIGKEIAHDIEAVIGRISIVPPEVTQTPTFTEDCAF